MTHSYDMELHRWKRPGSYFGAEWPDYYVIVGRSRDSDALEESNFRVALEVLGGEAPPAVVVVRETHWAVGWVEWVGVHKDNAAGLETARGLLARKESYPVLDDSDFYEEERTRAMLDLTVCHNLAEADAAKVADWCEHNGYPLEGEDYYTEGIEKARKALGLED